jgi:GH24 family phage-related lysozyme (muramidase)
MGIREGFAFNVYHDHKGYPTVGLGHLVQAGDRLKPGDRISAERIADLFYQDMKRLRILELTNVSWWGIPQKLGVASFIWSHGYGQYMGGQTQKMLQDRNTTREQAQAWVKNNWDRSSPLNQARNRADIDLFYTGTSLLSSGNFYWSQKLQDSYYNAELKNTAERVLPAVPSPKSSGVGIGSLALIGAAAGLLLLTGNSWK